MYTNLMLSGSLNRHLLEIDQIARDRIERITVKLLQENPAPDKAANPIGWTGHMNNLKQSAEEMVMMDLVYN